MALLNRVSQLFKADVHAVLDHVEEPEQTLKQAIRDMEDDLADRELRIAACNREQEELEARSEEICRTLADLDNELDLCFESGKDDLAKSLIKRKLLAGRNARQIESRMRFNVRFLERERARLEENQTTLESLRQKAEHFLSVAPGQTCGISTPEYSGLSGEFSVTEDEVEIAFLREQAARGGSPAPSGSES